MPKKQLKKEEVSDNVNDKLDQELSELGFKDIVDLAENMTDMSVSCVSTGFPQLDVVLHEVLKGMPKQRDIEIFSKEAEVGKTSLALDFIRSWQQQGYRTAYVDVERTGTVEYFHQCGIVTDTNDKNICAMRIIRPDNALSAEEILNLVKSVSNTFDLIVVDSIAAMDLKANLEKPSNDPNQVGGVSKLMSEFMRKNVKKRACIVWVNQTRMVIGGYNPTGNIRYSTTGGRAMLFFGTIRLELSIESRITGNNEDEYLGYKVKVFVAKNKVSPQWRSATLTYIFGEGFSTTYDWFQLALKKKVIEKSSSWFQFGDIRVQGEFNFYKRMRNDPQLTKDIKDAVMGNDIMEAVPAAPVVASA